MTLFGGGFISLLLLFGLVGAGLVVVLFALLLCFVVMYFGV